VATIETYARPLLLYRYRSLAARPGGDAPRADPARLKREIDTIIDQSIYCPTYKQMNDPMEGFYRASIKARGHSAYDEFAARVRDEKLGLGIASLSETWNNELMWAHYADGFRGICITYSVPKLLAGLSDEHALARVAYGDKPHFLNLAGLRNEDERARAILSTKNHKWSYEREWRLFSGQPGPAKHGPGAVGTVYLGMRMAREDRALIKRLLRGTNISIVQTLVNGYALKRFTKSSKKAPTAKSEIVQAVAKRSR
jgi:hypothetical protein